MKTPHSPKHRYGSVETLLGMPLVDDDLYEFSNLLFILLFISPHEAFLPPHLLLPFPLKTETMISRNVLYYISLLAAWSGAVGSYPWEST